MTNKEKDLVKAIAEADEKVWQAREERNRLQEQLATLAPHKVGEVIGYSKHNRRAVLASVRASIVGDTVYYDYEFQPIKADGHISHNYVCLFGDEPRWTGEQYQAPA